MSQAVQKLPKFWSRSQSQSSMHYFTAWLKRKIIQQNISTAMQSQKYDEFYGNFPLVTQA